MHYMLAGENDANLFGIDYDSSSEAWASGSCSDTATDHTACVDAIAYYSDEAATLAYSNVGGDNTNTVTPSTTFARTFYVAPLNEADDGSIEGIDTARLVITDDVDPTTGTAASKADDTYTPGSFTDGTYTAGSFTPGSFTPGSFTPGSYTPGRYMPATTRTDIDPGHKTTHVAVQLNVGGISPYLGYSKNKVNGARNDTKTTHYGLSGSLGDTGMNYLVSGRTVKAAGGGKSNPWLVGMTRSLDGGATLVFEHGNSDDGTSGNTRVGMHVNF